MKYRLSAAVLAALSASTALATGPDVIVGDIPDTTHYTVGAAVNGQRAYAFGTTSCNLGDTPLTWVDCTSGSQCNVHPVITQNMYRLSNGRFEQLGQAWLKHGFAALQGTVCSSCTPGGTCDALFPGCSDPYSSGLNGSQGGMGPKSEVNAATGAFPYPWVNQGVSDNATLFKRLRVNQTDVTSTTALFFVSCMYVQPEDAASHNNTNNESYRRITINQTSYDATLVDTTQRTKPGIQAWRDHGLGVGLPDPNVVLSNADVAGDGRFIVGVKTTDLGGGLYHYEYAIQNMSSDRSGASFSVPLPPNAVVTNVAFHGVPYHSGEPYSNTDWTGAATAGSVTWNSPQTFAQNPNGNALRWDTLYNFRFDCNIPPSGGAATIGLFKPGTPTSVTVGTIIPSPDGQFHPLNDTCAGATAVGAGVTNFSNVNAATDGPDEPNGCATGGYTAYGSDIWYSYTSTLAGDTTVSLCGSAFNTKLGIYPGATCPSAPGTLIACNDDFPGCVGGNGTQSEVTFTAAANTTYKIRIGGYLGAQGAGTMTITAPVAGGSAPANDNCTSAAWIADGVDVAGSTLNATHDGTSTCGNTTTSADVWYKYKPLTTGIVYVSTCGSAFNTVLSIHTACGGSQVACNDNALAGPCANDGSSSYAAMNMTAGTTYLIRVAGSSGARGTYTLRVTGGGGITPPSNDDCANRRVVGLGDTAFNNLAATTDGPTHTACGGDNTVAADVWFSFTATANGRLEVSTCNGSGYDTKLAVYNGAGCNNLAARLMACNDDNGCTALRARAVADVVGGQVYTIRVGGSNGATGSGTLSLTMLPNCVADVDDGSGMGHPDAGVTIDDLLYYLGIYGAGATPADVDDGSGTGAHDGGVTIDDLLYYLVRYAAGC